MLCDITQYVHRCYEMSYTNTSLLRHGIFETLKHCKTKTDANDVIAHDWVDFFGIHSLAKCDKYECYYVN